MLCADPGTCYLGIDCRDFSQSRSLAWSIGSCQRALDRIIPAHLHLSRDERQCRDGWNLLCLWSDLPCGMFVCGYLCPRDEGTNIGTDRSRRDVRATAVNFFQRLRWKNNVVCVNVHIRAGWVLKTLSGHLHVAALF